MTNIAAHFLTALDRRETAGQPFTHWLLDSMLPEQTCRDIDALPVQPPIIADTLGKRETHNSTRLFFALPQRADFPVCNAVATALQSAAVVNRLQDVCGIELTGSFLRIEYCLDSNGFWLEPHTDIGAKLFTMLIYLSNEPGSAAWGTDLLDGPGRLVSTTPYRRNSGLMFIPGTDTWHGFHRRPIRGVRRSLIVNFVRPEWRSRHELAFPDRAVVA